MQTKSSRSDPATADRLRSAIKQWGSINRLSQELADRDIPGHTRSMLHRYLKGDPAPPSTFLRAVAPILGVRREWLQFGEGEMHHRAQLLRERMEQKDNYESRRQTQARKTTHTLLIQLGLSTDPIYESATGHPRIVAERAASWSYPLSDLLVRWWDRLACNASDTNRQLPDEEETADRLGRAIVAPLRELGIRWENLKDEHRNDYILGMITLLSHATKTYEIDPR